MRLTAGLLLTLALSACGAGAAAPAQPGPAGQRPIVISDPRITGELGSPTPAPNQTGNVPGQQGTPQTSIGPISFQTQTPRPTPPFDIRDVAHDPRFVQSQPSNPAVNPPAGGQAAVALSNQPPAQPTPVPPAATPAPQAAGQPTPTPQLLGNGQTLAVNLPAGTSTCNTSQTFIFNYPGDSSTVTIDAQLNGLDPSNAGNAGMNVWDSTSATAPATKATTLTNQKNSVPGSIELTYSRAIGGQVTVELYNWAQVNLTGTVTAVSLASNSSPLQVGAVRQRC